MDVKYIETYREKLNYHLTKIFISLVVILTMASNGLVFAEDNKSSINETENSKAKENSENFLKLILLLRNRDNSWCNSRNLLPSLHG